MKRFFQIVGFPFRLGAVLALSVIFAPLVFIILCFVPEEFDKDGMRATWEWIKTGEDTPDEVGW